MTFWILSFKFCVLGRQSSRWVGSAGTAVGRTPCTKALEGHFCLSDDKTRRQIPGTIERRLDIGNRSTRFTVKMAVFLQVCAITRWSTAQVYLFYQAPIHQGLQTVINRRQRDRRHMFLRTQKHLSCCRVIPSLH